MTRGQRRLHAAMWPVLGVLLLGAIVALSLSRPTPLPPLPKAGTP